MKKGKFADRGKSILKPDKPTDISSFLDDEEKESVRKDVKPETQTKKKETVRKPGKTDKRKTVKPDTSKTVKPETRTKAKKEDKPTPKTVREEFRLPYALAEKLRKYAFDNRETKTAVVVEALEKFL